MFATVWTAGTWRVPNGWPRLVMAPVAVSALGLIAEYGSTPQLAPNAVRLESLAMFLLVGAFMVWVAAQDSRRSSISHR